MTVDDINQNLVFIEYFSSRYFIISRSIFGARGRLIEGSVYTPSMDLTRAMSSKLDSPRCHGLKGTS